MLGRVRWIAVALERGPHSRAVLCEAKSNMGQLSDEQLLSAMLAGEMDALAALVARHQGPLTGYLDRLVGPDWALA
jgi:hypothetical protein